MSDWAAMQKWRCACGHEWEQKPKVFETNDGRIVAGRSSSKCQRCGLEWRSELAKQRMTKLDGQLAVWEEGEETA